MGSNVIDGSGFYNEHWVQQAAAAEAGVALLRDAAGAIPLPADGPVVVADYGASQGRNSARQLRAALERVRARDPDAQFAVVHTYLPAHDFSSLFDTVAGDAETYATRGVFTFAAGRSFYERLFPDASVSLGWSATAVVWLREAPCPLPNHLFSYMADGDRRQQWGRAAADDWQTFLRLRAAELRPGGELVVTTLVSGPGYVDWMTLIEAAASDAVDSGTIEGAELEAMVIPTYIREPEELFGGIEVAALPLKLADSTIRTAPDPAFESFEQHGDATRYSEEAVAAYRAWSEPALLSALRSDRTDDERAATADALYEHARARLEAAPTECAWHIGLARIRREGAGATA